MRQSKHLLEIQAYGKIQQFSSQFGKPIKINKLTEMIKTKVMLTYYSNIQAILNRAYQATEPLINYRPLSIIEES